MARIDEALGKDVFQQVRDKIAEILLDELANQATLSGNKDLEYGIIWMERRRPFNLSEIPAINLSILGINYNTKFRHQRQPDVTYTIDIYNTKNHTEDDADELVMDSIWDVARTVQYILDHPHYASLGLTPLISHSEVVKITSGEAEMSDGARCGILRVEFKVNMISVENPFEQIALELSSTSVKIEQTDKGYFYQLQN